MAIDITFDFRNDASGRDPDSSSPTMLRYHNLLWSKPLPSGTDFDLTPQSHQPHALVHDSDLGFFRLTSDSVLPTLTRRRDMQAIIGQLPPADIDAFNAITYTIGGMILWPGNRIDGRWTINQARGCTGRIADRFDLTIECVRRHYEGDTTHPLGDVLARYGSFFDLFESFAGYVDFWLLDDLLDAEGGVKFFLASDDSPCRQSLVVALTTWPFAIAPLSSSRRGIVAFPSWRSDVARVLLRCDGGRNGPLRRERRRIALCASRPHRPPERLRRVTPAVGPQTPCEGPRCRSLSSEDARPARDRRLFQQRLDQSGLDEVTAVEAAVWPDDAGVLKESPTRPGLPLRELPRAGKILHAEQRPPFPNGGWYIVRERSQSAGAGPNPRRRRCIVMRTSASPLSRRLPARTEELGGTIGNRTRGRLI